MTPSSEGTCWAKCYCGGFLKWAYQRRKTNDWGRFYVYKKPRWQLVNCFPEAK